MGSAVSKEMQKADEWLYRRVILLVLALALTGCAPREPAGQESYVIELEGKNIQSLAREMGQGTLTSAALVRHFIDRIEAEDGVYRSVISLDPGALAAAERLDQARDAGEVRGLLHGIPILIKDNIETLGLPTTAGSMALADSETGRDATIVARLREAGAVILGKTNLSEWANFRSDRSSSGWSAVGGQTGNAHDVTRSPCGSSSGSGVAVALGFAVAAVGTETNGSIVCPASINGVVGLKPTVGLLPRTHIVPISPTQDTAGPMTRSVADAAILLAVMQGADPADESTTGTSAVAADHYLPAGTALAGVRLGVIRTSVGHPRVQALLEARLQTLEDAGAELVEDVVLEPYSTFRDDTYGILLYEFRDAIRAYLSSLEGERAGWTLEDLIAFNEANAAAEQPHFGQETFLAARDLPWTTTDYAGALTRVRQATRDEGIDRALAEHRLDAIVSPSNGPAWKIDPVNGDRGVGGFSTFPAVAGYPHITLPMGRVHGLPVGLSLVSGAGSERRLIELAASVEAALEGAGLPAH